MAKFRKKPVVIDAVQNEGRWPPIFDWLRETTGSRMVFQPGQKPPITRNDDGTLLIHTLEGEMRADVGDWIIRGVKGELYPCRADIFAMTYEAVDAP